MNWLIIFLIYYVLVYLLIGRILVDLFGLTTWETMIGILVGCCLGHYLGKMDRIGSRLGKVRRL